MATIGLQALLHAAARSVPFPPLVAAEIATRHVPGRLATAAIDVLGHAAPWLLEGGLVVGALAVGTLVAHRSTGMFAGLAATLSLALGIADPHRPAALGVFVSAIAAVAPAVLARATRPSQEQDASAGVSRRRVLGWMLGAAAMASLGAVAVLRRIFVDVPRVLVRADQRAKVYTDARFDTVAGLSPKVTSRTAHYTVDIDLSDPALAEETWRLLLTGMVARSRAWSLQDLREMPTFEQPVTMTCISNPVGGPLISTALWTGVPLHELLRRSGARRRFVHVRAADGYTESFPIEAVSEGMIAFGMNGRLLPQAHGFPARLIVPGRYGMRNVKWLMELTVGDRQRPGYWQARGWDREGVIRTGSRIDAPAHHGVVASSFVAAGVAWAGDRGVESVEVSADDGVTWSCAQLEAPAGPLAWRRWQLRLDLPPGMYSITVRATDGRGHVQDAERRPPHPSGASGYHRIDVTVR